MIREPIPHYCSAKRCSHYPDLAIELNTPGVSTFTAPGDIMRLFRTQGFLLKRKNRFSRNLTMPFTGIRSLFRGDDGIGRC